VTGAFDALGGTAQYGRFATDALTSNAQDAFVMKLLPDLVPPPPPAPPPTPPSPPPPPPPSPPRTSPPRRVRVRVRVTTPPATSR